MRDGAWRGGGGLGRCYIGAQDQEERHRKQARTSGPREAAAEENRPVGGSRGHRECRLPGCVGVHRGHTTAL